ncbi:MAG: RNA polymerase-binding protein DksA [Campylobacter sp.]|nr:RNA polymerase-binding protein DksA [Campylobacter sp.]
MNDKDLSYFKNLLLTRKAQILKNLADATNEAGARRDCGAVDEADIASISSDELIGQSISAQQQTELAEIETSLKKIEDKTYGICEMCEEDIAMARMKAKPHAKYCIICREIVEKTQR